MNVDKLFTSKHGEPFTEITINKYYLQNGVKTDKAPTEGDYEARAEIGLQIHIPANFRETGDEVRDIALKHSLTRKAQENAQAVRRSDGDFQVMVDTFTGADDCTYFKILKGEREKAERAEESRESQYIRELASVLRDKIKAGYDFATAKVEVPRHADPPKTEKGTVNFTAWAKIVRDSEHPWYDLAVKTVDKKADKYA